MQLIFLICLSVSMLSSIMKYPYPYGQYDQTNDDGSSQDVDADLNDGSSGDDGEFNNDTSFDFDDSSDHIPHWIYVSVPALGTYSLRQVMTEGSDGWLAVESFGDPIDTYQSVTILNSSNIQMDYGIVMLMPTPGCLGDYDDSGHVDAVDLYAFVEFYSTRDIEADLNMDSVVNINDQILFFSLVSRACAPEF